MRASSIASSTPSADAPLERIGVVVATADAERAVAELCQLVGAGCVEHPAVAGRVRLEVWAAAGRTDPARLRVDLAARGLDAAIDVAAQDGAWRTAMERFHRPVVVADRLLVRPPWESPRPGLADVVIDPGMAFGTAQHGTTRACLTLLAALPTRGRLLDAGCGTGVLAIAARRLGFDPVWAIDFDPLAVEATLVNAHANRVGLRVGRRTIGVDPLPAVEVVVANLTLTILRRLAAALPAPAPRHLIISGLRPEEADQAAALFAPAGLAAVERVNDDGWTTVRLDGRGASAG